MVCDPYICIKGPKAGEIYWVKEGDDCFEHGRKYADFEREKLEELGWSLIDVGGCGYGRPGYCGSLNVTGYSGADYARDSESNRLLKRAEFLKAVCQQEGVEWLPKEPPKEKCSCCHRAYLLGCTCHPCNCTCHLAGLPKQPERDYYTREEIDKRISGLLDLILVTCPKEYVATFQDCRDIFRKRFLDIDSDR